MVRLRARLSRPPTVSDTLIAPVPVLSPSSYRTWLDCRRAYLLRHVLALPAPDEPSHASGTGQLVHDVLHHVHERGSCRDEGFVDDVATAHSLTPATRALVDAHRRRCPDDATHSAHEVERVRLHRRPWWVGRTRLDAVWVRPGLLDVRDYKTGSRTYDHVRDDPGARVMAWVLQRDMARKRLPLRIVYEQLAPEVDEDPEPFEPDDDDLAAIDVELSAAVEAIKTETAWTGISEADVCKRCAFRSVCTDSAAPGPIGWPAASIPP